VINLSYLEVPLYNGKKSIMTKLKDAMFYTAEPLYKAIQIEFTKIHKIVNSDYRQYSPFEFIGGKKISEAWNNDNQDLIILDIDDGITIDDAKHMFQKYKYFICTTKSHRLDKKGLTCDRFRVILQSNDIPKGDAYFDFTRELESLYPFIDKQVNTKTGAFLGHNGCTWWYNDGKLFECAPLLEISRARKVARENLKEINIKEYEDDGEVEKIKAGLSRERVADIVSSCGFDVNRNFKFKYREERTPSASIKQDGYIKDFGGDLSTDAIGFVQEAKGIGFKEALNYVRNFV